MRWRFLPQPANEISAPNVGPDGIIYIAHLLSYLSAINPNGTLRWRVFDGSIVDDPIVAPSNRVIVVGGSPNLGVPGFVCGYNP